nr:AlNc14C217G9036 [Albugo laibachii Nc14]|eukprot:CCA24004.1 AlNc14C217G9036 [Albugo laibachii Nc14]
MNTELEVLTLCKRDIARWRESPRNLTEMQLMSYFCIQGIWELCLSGAIEKTTSNLRNCWIRQHNYSVDSTSFLLFQYSPQVIMAKSMLSVPLLLLLSALALDLNGKVASSDISNDKLHVLYQPRATGTFRGQRDLTVSRLLNDQVTEVPELSGISLIYGSNPAKLHLYSGSLTLAYNTTVLITFKERTTTRYPNADDVAWMERIIEGTIETKDVPYHLITTYNKEAVDKLAPDVMAKIPLALKAFKQYLPKVSPQPDANHVRVLKASQWEK